MLIKLRMIIGLIGIVCGPIVCANAITDSCQQNPCIAVVDAGSTGSRLHIYTYTNNNQQEPINIQELYAYKIKPGFASLPSTATSIANYLTTLLPEESLKNMPIYFYATAGMRSLPESEQQEKYDLLRSWFAQQNLNLKEAKTLSGREEGTFGWLSVNYQSGGLSANNATLSGVMDIGGASTQVAFVVQDNVGIMPSDRVDLDIYNHHYTLFVHSFLGLGVNEVYSRYNTTVNCFAKEYQLPNGVLADGKASFCAETLASEMDNTYGVQALVKPILLQSRVNNWMVLGAISSMVKNTPYTFTQQQFTPKELLAQSEANACAISWDLLKTTYPENEFLSSTCLNAAYYYALTVDGYGIPDTQQIHYAAADEPDWSLGVVFQQ